MCSDSGRLEDNYFKTCDLFQKAVQRESLW